MRHLLSILDLETEELLRLVNDSTAVARGEWNAEQPLKGCAVGIYFPKTSTRTRTSFTLGAQRLGAMTIAYGPNDLQLVTGETLSDTARVLANYMDVLVIRTNGSMDDMRQFAAQGRMSIVNAMSEDEHPTQALADLSTLQEAFGRLSGLHVLYIGEGNNTAASLALAVAKVPGMRLTLVTPAGYGLPGGILESARQSSAAKGGAVLEHHDMEDLPQGVDAVYTARWLTMGVKKPDENWLDLFRPYTITPTVMARVSKRAGTVFLHDLPAMRGHEVVDDVLDGPQSIAFRQAFHKMTSAMAVLAWCVGDKEK